MYKSWTIPLENCPAGKTYQSGYTNCLYENHLAGPFRGGGMLAVGIAQDTGAYADVLALYAPFFQQRLAVLSFEGLLDPVDPAGAQAQGIGGIIILPSMRLPSQTPVGTSAFTSTNRIVGAP